MKYRKKLIEVALPLEAINRAAAQEKQPGIGAHPRGLHLWWARRPLATARAVIFSQMVDDPSSRPEFFPTEKEQTQERDRLFEIIKDLVKWENTTNQTLIDLARLEIRKSWERTCEDNILDHNFDKKTLPAFHDPFAGGGALPLEAQRLGLESFATDLNPVPVLINKSMIEIPPKFANKKPVNPDSNNSMNLIQSDWGSCRGLSEDVIYYGRWMKNEAEKKIGHLYPEVEITDELIVDRPDLKKYKGKKLSVVAWIWTRTVQSPNPAFLNVHVPLASTFMLSSKPGKEAYINPVITGESYAFEVKVGKPDDADIANGTKLGRGSNFKCLMSGVPISPEHIKNEGKASRMGTRLMAVILQGNRERVYLPPISSQENVSKLATPEWRPEVNISGSTQYLGTKPYGIERFDQLFTDRQLMALSEFSALIPKVIKKIEEDAVASGMSNDGIRLESGGVSAKAYSEAVGVYLSFAISRLADYNSSVSTWKPSGEQVMQTFKRQAIAMTWDFPESNVLGNSAICWLNAVKYSAENLLAAGGLNSPAGHSFQSDASTQDISTKKVVSTDPPYYDNVPYADLSDFFYIWLRRSLKLVFPDLFSTMAVPKLEELVAFAYRHEDGKSGAEAFFLNGMTNAMHRISEQAHPAYPVTIYYAFKQAESDDATGTTNTGWETFLDSVIKAGFLITGTWPMRTEMSNRMRGMDSNALATSIVLVCRKRLINAPIISRRDFISSLKAELPESLRHLQAGNIAPVDLAQAALGPGMAIYTRYSKVIDAEGNNLSVKTALALINEVLDDALMQQDGDFDADTRWAITWFEQFGFNDGDYGVAEQLSKSKNTSVSGLVEAGILFTKAGKVKLIKPVDLSTDWNPKDDTRLTVWEIVHHLVRALESGGENAAAVLVNQLESKAEIARELCYRLYTMCERKKRPVEAMAYNGLVQSWLEITRLANENPLNLNQGVTVNMFEQDN